MVGVPAYSRDGTGTPGMGAFLYLVTDHHLKMLLSFNDHAQLTSQIHRSML